MPVKRRANKRKLTDAAMLEAWAGTFQSGYDFFGELPALGVQTDDHSRPDTDAARAAWQQLGTAYLATNENPHREPWALTTFGQPENGHA